MERVLDAVSVIGRRASADRADAAARWAAAQVAEPFERCAEHFRTAGRLTVNLHPDRLDRLGRPVAAGLLQDGAYRSQWLTGISAGSRSAVPGGERQRFEHHLFDGVYDGVDPLTGAHPVYGALDLLLDDHGGSPRFGSSYLVLAPQVRERTTLCIGDSHQAPRDVGTFDQPWPLLAGLAEQAQQGRLLERPLGTDALIAAVRGEPRPRTASRNLDGYVEIQVHGGLSLGDDVDAVVLDPSFRGTEIEDLVSQAAARYDLRLAWHCGSELAVDDVPADFRGPTMPFLARDVAGADGRVDARAIGRAAARSALDPPSPTGDGPEHPLQQLKYLWHTLVAHGHDADRPT